MKKRHSIIILAVLNASMAFTAELTFLQQAYQSRWAPFFWVDQCSNKREGVIPRVMDKVASSLGYSLRWYNGRPLISLEESLAIRNQQLQDITNSFALGIPLYSPPPNSAFIYSRQPIITLEYHETRLREAASQVAAPVGFVNDSIASLSRYTDIETRQFDNTDLAITALLAGEISALVEEKLFIRALTAELDVIHEVEIADETVFSIDMHLLINTDKTPESLLLSVERETERLYNNGYLDLIKAAAIQAWLKYKSSCDSPNNQHP